MKTARLPLDKYMTPGYYLAPLVAEINFYGSVIEPCAGDGAIAGPLGRIRTVRQVVTNDIDRKVDARYHFDAGEPWPGTSRFDWAVTNPPFGAALPIIEQMLEHADNVACLTRLSFLEPCEDRAYLLEQNSPTQVIVLPRHSFRTNAEGRRQTDNVTCCWLVWHADKLVRRIASWSRSKCEALAIIHGLEDAE